MEKEMCLKNLLHHIDFMTNVILYEQEDEVFKGNVLDIPWIYAEFCLDSDENGEAISVRKNDDKDGKTYLIICIKENPDD